MGKERRGQKEEDRKKDVLSPRSHCGRWASTGSDSGGEKKYNPQKLSGLREVTRILCEGWWYRIDDICGQRTISA